MQGASSGRGDGWGREQLTPRGWHTPLTELLLPPLTTPWLQARPAGGASAGTFAPMPGVGGSPEIACLGRTSGNTIQAV